MKMLALLSATLVWGVSNPLLCDAAAKSRSDFISFDAPGADATVGTYAQSINNWGAITGYYADPSGALHGFLRGTEGRITTIDVPGATPEGGTFPAAINDLGVITGNFGDAKGTHGFLRTPDGHFETFDAPGAAGFTNPIAMNLEGEVVGAYQDASLLYRAFLRRPDGSITTFAGPGVCDDASASGCFGTAAFSINIFGVSVGTFEAKGTNSVSESFLRRSDGKPTVFKVPGAGIGPSQGTGCFGCGVTINSAGAITGNFIDGKNVSHGYVRTAEGQFITFDVPGAGAGPGQGTGCFTNCPVGFNDFGAVTGTYVDSQDNLNGFLRSPSGKLATINPPGAVQTEAVAINDSGAVVGYYVDAQNLLHSFLRRATPL